MSTTLAYPAAAPTTTVVVRNPDFGNSISDDNQIELSRDRKGGLHAVRPSTWPTLRVQTFNLSNLTAVEKEAIRDLILESQGKEVKITDWEGTVTTGLLSLGEVSLIKEGRLCKYSVSLSLVSTT